MAFLVQPDGSAAVAGATSYVSVAFFRDFMADEGIDTSAWNDAKVETTLVSVTRFAEGEYPWIGRRTTDEANRLHFPASGARVLEGNPRYRFGYLLPDTAVPLSLMEGICWLALAQLETGKRINQLYVERSKILKSKTVGPIAKVFERPLAQDRFPAAERCFAGLWDSGDVGHGRLVR
jgi:hypothetical protein